MYGQTEEQMDIRTYIQKDGGADICTYTSRYVRVDRETDRCMYECTDRRSYVWPLCGSEFSKQICPPTGYFPENVIICVCKIR
jgi:hypothetical protein